MIYDSVDRLYLYGSNELWQKICAVATQLDPSIANGEYPIQGKEAFYRVMEYNTKLPEQGRIEGHLEYIDIQFTLEGAEGIDIFPLHNHQAATPYDTEADVLFYETTLPPLANTVNVPDFFTLLFPHDLHRPQMMVAGCTHVKKAVIKLAVSSFA